MSDILRKTCSRCRESKPVEAFTRSNQTKDGRYPWCRDCRREAASTPQRRAQAQEQRRTCYLNHREEILARNRAHRRVRPAEERRPRQRPCPDCGQPMDRESMRCRSCQLLLDTTTEKACRTCEITKPLRCFQPSRRSPDGRTSQCQVCWQAERRRPASIAIPPVDLAWLAGLLEGEGHFNLYRKDRRYNSDMFAYPGIRLTMTDADVVQRAHQVAGMGYVHGPHQPPSSQSHHLPRWTWQVTRTGDALALLEALRPFMGNRRTQQIQVVLDGAGFVPGPA